MNTTSTFPYHLNWTAQDLADAVPLRLFELFEFDAEDAPSAGNDQVPRTRRGWRNGYLASTALPTFVRVRQ